MGYRRATAGLPPVWRALVFYGTSCASTHPIIPSTHFIHSSYPLILYFSFGFPKVSPCLGGYVTFAVGCCLAAARLPAGVGWASRPGRWLARPSAGPLRPARTEKYGNKNLRQTEETVSEMFETPWWEAVKEQSLQQTLNKNYSV